MDKLSLKLNFRQCVSLVQLISFIPFIDRFLKNISSGCWQYFLVGSFAQVLQSTRLFILSSGESQLKIILLMLILSVNFIILFNILTSD